MPKNKIKAKSTTRKPLRDVSNGNIMFPKPVNKKAPHDTKDGDKAPHNTNNDDEVQEDNALDRLLLVHTHLSSLIHQMDELVVQAFKVKSNKGRKEVQSFTQVLTEIQSSLEPWVPRFQKALSSNSIVSENQGQSSLLNGTVSIANEDTNFDVQSPEHTKYCSRVSPSPLVSWRADCTIEVCRQLFVLTPLPRPKAFSSKLQCPSNPTFKAPSCGFAICGHTDNDSLVVMTPRLKTSPPKSCVLLEPISERNNRRFRKSTPYPVGIQNFSYSESSSSGASSSESLGLKYPQLLGVEASPNWFISPPKTCVLMEPPPDDENTLANSTRFPKTSCVQNQPTRFSVVKENDFQSNCQAQNPLIECTPMLMEPESSFQTGKRAGENTLKRELWIRFEAASLRQTARKGFLDRLEEASFDEDKSGA